MFRSRLDQILNRRHPLFLLANQIDWQFFDNEFGQLFVENFGRPGLPTRLIVGMHYLKHAFSESDESVVGRFLENPYWQHFCGFEYFQHELPLDPSSLVRWRKRLGPERLEQLLVETLETAKRGKLLTMRHVEHVNVDTTVEFGCKVAMVTSSIKNWVLAIDALHGNPFDGHTLKQSLEQVKRVTGWQPLHAYCDRGYRGAGKDITDTMVHLAGKKKKSMKPGIWRWYARRAAIEPIFGHLKSDNRLERNHLKGKDGDRMNAILAGCGFNMRKLLGAFFLLIFHRLILGQTDESGYQRAPYLSSACAS